MDKITEIKENTRSLLQSKFGNIVFEEIPHRYTIDGVEYTPVSNIISQYENPFDEDRISKNYAEKNGLNQKEVLKQWKWINRCSTIMGTRAHEFGESYTNLMCGHKELICEQNKPQYIEEENWLVPTFPQEFAVKKFYDELHRNLHPIGAEFKLSTQYIEGAKPICGTTDILFYYDAPNPKDSGFVVGDWKGLYVNTPIFTTDGWKTMETIQVGDTVFDKNGEQCKVLHTSTVHNDRKCYKIIFDNKDEIICDNEHRWLIKKGKKEEVMLAVEIFDYLQKHPYRKGSKEKLMIKNNKPLKTNGLNEIEKNLGICGASFTEMLRYGGYLLNNVPPTFSIVNFKSTNRWRLLGYVMDEFGKYNPNTNLFSIYIPHEEYINLIRTLLSSLGIKSDLHCQKERHSIRFKCNYDPFMWKEAKMFSPYRKEDARYRTIVKIIEIDTVPTRCIEVDSETHTYLCGKNFLVTHNTNRELTKDFIRSNNIKMLPPFDNMYDEALSHYYVQFNLYQRMLESAELKIIARRLIHLKNDGTYQVHTVPKIDDKIIEQIIKQ
jgi:hypothetical protein